MRLFLARRRTSRRISWWLGVLAFSHVSVNAQEPDRPPEDAIRPSLIELPVLDLPGNVANGGVLPSMQQSLGVTLSTYSLARRGIATAFRGKRRATQIAIGTFDALVAFVPGGFGWLHEEWHRAVLSQHGVSSFNGTYKFPLFSDVITVSRVRDEDLARLKREHPAVQVRLMEAGVESTYQLLLALERREFFFGGMEFSGLLRWTLVSNAILYVATGTLALVEEFTTDRNAEDGSDVSVRDFTGNDVTAWVFDLHRPEEAYEARGTHPSGVGVDRYISPTDLTREEFSFLRLQGRLAFLNLLDPFLFGVGGFSVGHGDRRVRLNATIRHFLTSFGYSIDANLFVAHPNRDLVLAVRNYFNGERWFPGVDVELRQSLVTRRGSWHVSPRLALWLQPDEQRFRTTDSRLGGLAAISLRSKSDGLRPYLEVEAKSAGWVPGIVHLGAALSVRVGLRVVLR